MSRGGTISVREDDHVLQRFAEYQRFHRPLERLFFFFFFFFFPPLAQQRRSAANKQFDPYLHPELFRGVLTRRFFAFLIDLVVLSIPVILACLFIAVFGIVTLGLGWALFWLVSPASIIWALVYFGSSLGGSCIRPPSACGPWTCKCAPGTASRLILCSAGCTRCCSGCRCRSACRWWWRSGCSTAAAAAARYPCSEPSWINSSVRCRGAPAQFPNLMRRNSRLLTAIPSRESFGLVAALTGRQAFLS